MTRLHRTETRGPISKHIYRRNAERWIYQSIVLLRERPCHTQSGWYSIDINDDEDSECVASIEKPSSQLFHCVPETKRIDPSELESCVQKLFFFCPIRLLVNVLLSQDTLGALTNRFIRRQYVSTKSFQFDPPNNSSHRQSESNRKRRNLQSHKLMTHNQISRRALLNDRESHQTINETII